MSPKTHEGISSQDQCSHLQFNSPSKPGSFCQSRKASAHSHPVFCLLILPTTCSGQSYSFYSLAQTSQRTILTSHRVERRSHHFVERCDHGREERLYLLVDCNVDFAATSLVTLLGFRGWSMSWRDGNVSRLRVHTLISGARKADWRYGPRSRLVH